MSSADDTPAADSSGAESAAADGNADGASVPVERAAAEGEADTGESADAASARALSRSAEARRADRRVYAVRERNGKAKPRNGGSAEHRRPERKSSKLSEGARAERRLGLLLITPATLVMLAVTAYPILDALWLSFQRYDLRFPDKRRVVWFDNYADVLSDGYWWQAFGVTVTITVVSVAFEFVLGLLLALIMHRTIVGKGVVRTVALIPYGIVTVAAAYSWYYAWTPGTGYLAGLLPHGDAPLTQHWPALGIIVLAEVWKTTPFMALLLLAGLALVPDELLRAASLDGAGPWTRLTKITLPLMKPAILVALLFRTLDAFRIFDNIYVMTRGARNTGSLSILGYDNLFKAFNLGIGSAISVLIFLCVAAIAFVFVKMFGASAPGAEAEGR